MDNIKFAELYMYDVTKEDNSSESEMTPVVVLQADDINRICQTTIVAPLTTSIKKPYIYSHVVLGSRFGLNMYSMINLEELKTVSKESLIMKIGEIDDTVILKEILLGLRKVLNIYNPCNSKNSISRESKKNKVKYGEVYLYNFDSNTDTVIAESRPVVVIQRNEINKISKTTLVAAINVANKCPYLPSHVFLEDKYGLRSSSMVMLEQIAVVNQSDLVKHIGTISDERTLTRIYFGLRKCFGMWDYSLKRSCKVSTLCENCLSEIIGSKEYIVKRLDCFQPTKNLCSVCNCNFGYDYLLVPNISI